MTWMIAVPAPSTRAPILLSTRPSSSTSGSRAQLTSVVRPLASAAAIIRFSVPVTVDSRRRSRRRAARRFGDHVAVLDADLGAQRLEALQVLIDRPRADRAAARQRHLGATVARDQRARARARSRASAARARTAPRADRRQRSRRRAPRGLSTVTSRPEEPEQRRRGVDVAQPGTLRSRLSPSESSVAHRIGSAAFFAPPTRIRPASRREPRMRKASMSKVGEE